MCTVPYKLEQESRERQINKQIANRYIKQIEGDYTSKRLKHSDGIWEPLNEKIKEQVIEDMKLNTDEGMKGLLDKDNWAEDSVFFVSARNAALERLGFVNLPDYMKTQKDFALYQAHTKEEYKSARQGVINLVLERFQN